MSRIHVPSIKGYDCYRKYLNDVILSKEFDNSPMSYRFLAKKVNCSPSYLNDVAKGRTNLRLGKAMAIADFLGLDSNSKTHWILLLLKEIETPEVSNYFTTQLQNPTKKINGPEPVLDHKLKIGIQEMSVFSFIVWKKGKTNCEEIASELTTFSMSEEEVQSYIDRWAYRGQLIVNNDGTFEPIIEQMYLKGECEHATKIQIEFKENFSRYCENPKSPGSFDSGFVAIPHQMIPEVMEKFRELKNWVFEVERKYLSHENLGGEDSELFQYNIDLVTMTESKNCPGPVREACKGPYPL